MSLILSCQIPFRFYNSISRNVKWKKLLFNNSKRCMGNTNTAENRETTTFLDTVKNRRNQARRSLLVQVQSSQSYKELYSYCSSIGTVTDMQHYNVGVEPLNFIVVEFASETDVKTVLARTSHHENSQAVAIHSQFLWFRASHRRLPKLKECKGAALSLENGTRIAKEMEIRDNLKKCQTISDQMLALYNETKLNDLGIRLRYLTARQIESCVSGMFPHASALPFGSSVNGYGRIGCDLDLVLRLSDENKKDDSRLVFHCKAPSGSERSTAQRNMEVIGDIIQLFLPGCAQVRRILQAKVPIIKYYQQLTDIECDLSMANLSGVYMSDFLHMMGSIDERIRPLVFTIRKWAHDVGLTNSSPGRWISNFSLTLMVLAFLQKPIRSAPVLPSLNTLVKLAGPEDKFVTDDGINCTFLRNVSKLNMQTKNHESLDELLKEFFEFYSLFDYESKAICLNEAVALPKPEHSPLYIVNPMERGLNVSKNVSAEELDRFKVEVRNAAWLLESQENVEEKNWGLLSLFENKRRNINALNFALSNKHNRLMDVSTLFGEEDIQYKNDSVKKQVQGIKTETQKKISEFKKLNR